MPINQFIGPRPWPRITDLASKPSKAQVAVPFFGKNAAKMLPLTDGSILVTRFDVRDVKSGQIHPLDIVAMIKRGVRVYQHQNLHAKIYVFGRRAVIGSANASGTSAGLDEACIETSDMNVVAKAREFITGIVGDEITLEYAKSMQRFYRPPIFTSPNRGKTPQEEKKQSAHSKIWTIPLSYGGLDDADEAALKNAKKDAKSKISNSERFKVEQFRWSGGELRNVQVGDRVMQQIKNGNAIEFYSPGRVISIHSYRVGKQQRKVFNIETRKYSRFLLTGDMRKKLGKDDLAALNSDKPKLIRQAALRNKIGQIWALEPE